MSERTSKTLTGANVMKFTITIAVCKQEVKSIEGGSNYSKTQNSFHLQTDSGATGVVAYSVARVKYTARNRRNEHLTREVSDIRPNELRF